MMNSRFRIEIMVLATLAATATAVATAPQETRRFTSPPVLGMDHIPLAVADLEVAAEHYRRLGFTLKPGRPHDNGIRNQHVKFRDGTEIELITAVEARDALTTEYVRHLAKGDGPAFVSFFAPEMNRVAGYLDVEGRTYWRSEGLLSFPETDSLRYIFFGGRNRSPTDRPEHFRHANGAEGLVGVWIAGDDLTAERRLFAGLRATFTEEEVHVPETVRGVVARVPHGEVVFLPGSRQLVPGRRIVGATISVRDLKLLQSALAKGRLRVPPVVQTECGSSVFLGPDITHGMWLEFREER